MNKATTAKRIFYKGRAIFCLVATAAFTMGLLTGCTSAEAPVVTSDNIQPNTAATDAMAQAAGNGKNYTYFWQAEDVESYMDGIKASLEQELADLEKSITESKSSKEADASFTANMQENYDELKSHMEEILAGYRERIEAEATLNPVITPQEAANLGAVAIEQCYGVDLSQQTLELYCDINDALKSGRAKGRSVWLVYKEEAADGVLLSDYTAS